MSTTTRESTVAAGRLEELLRSGLLRARATGRPVLVSYTESIGLADPLDFYRRGSATGESCAYWERPEEDTALVGLGVAYRIEAAGARHASAAMSQWRHLIENAEIWPENDPAGAGPVLMGGFAFDLHTPSTDLWDGYPPGLLLLPRWMLTNREGRSWLTTNVVLRPDSDMDGALAALHATPLRAQLPAPDAFEGATLCLQEAPPAAEWKATVTQVVRDIRAGHAEKVVLARAVRVLWRPKGRARGSVPAGGPQPEAVLRRLRAAYPECTIFAVSPGGGATVSHATFLGASPERLISLRDGEVLAASLAGSRPRGADAAEDARLGDELLASRKDRAEHEIVRRMLTGALREVCDRVNAPAAPRLLKLSNVQHLYTPVTARARAGQTVLDLVGRLHPTPAVGGMPRQEAMELIRRREGLDRGWYAGPVGWVDRRGGGEFVVGIRSALLRSSGAMLFAGCGIMPDSDPEMEHVESDWKLRPMLAALGGRSLGPEQNAE